MDPVLTAAGRALAAGNVLEALKRVALRHDAPALTLRAVALAQLGELARARELLRAAARAFGTQDPLGRARCLLADAELALYTRELAGVEPELDSLSRTLAAHGDRWNTLHARCLLARSLLLRGQLAEAKSVLGRLQLRRAPALLHAEVELARAELAFRVLDARAARSALARAEAAAKAARFPALQREVATAQVTLSLPVARVRQQGAEQLLDLAALALLLQKKRILFVDALRQSAGVAGRAVPLARRPVLFALLRALAVAWPNAAPRASLISGAFGVTRHNESHRGRLRVEIGRLRRALHELVEIRPTKAGFRLVPRVATDIVLLTRPADDEHAPLLALLADGEAWSSSALGVALGTSQRSMQRALSSLVQAGKVRATGRARAKRWLGVPSARFATPLLLPSWRPIA